MYNMEMDSIIRHFTNLCEISPATANISKDFCREAAEYLRSLPSEPTPVPQAQESSPKHLVSLGIAYQYIAEQLKRKDGTIHGTQREQLNEVLLDFHRYIKNHTVDPKKIPQGVYFRVQGIDNRLVILAPKVYIENDYELRYWMDFSRLVHEVKIGQLYIIETNSKIEQSCDNCECYTCND